MRTVPIHERLNRIRWDAEFARGNFELGYFDRVEERIFVIPFAEVSFPRDDPQAFRLMDGRRIPKDDFRACRWCRLFLMVRSST
jgi:uncharacterized protein (UPF0248 family)